MNFGQRFFNARTKLNKHGEQTPRKVYKETGVTASSIELYESGDRTPNMKNAQILADYYGVNVLWLLGKSESPSVDENSQTVTKITGLSPKAIENLQKVMVNKYQIDCVNGILESDEFAEMIERISIAIKIHKSPFYNPASEATGRSFRKGFNSGNHPFVMDKLTKSETVDYYLWSASDKMGRIIRNVVEKEEN